MAGSAAAGFRQIPLGSIGCCEALQRFARSDAPTSTEPATKVERIHASLVLESLDFGIKRLAFGVQLFCPLLIGWRVQASPRFLKDRIRFETEEYPDFIYQINHPVRSKTGIHANRLTKWSATAVPGGPVPGRN